MTPHNTPLLLAPDSVRRVLVCQLRQIGDVLLTTPSIELLARRFPKAEVHVFTESKCLPMLENNPHVTRVWAVNKKALPTLAHELAFYWKVAATGFDIVVDFQQLPRCRWVVGMSRAPVRLSFPPPWYLRPLYTHWTKPSPAYAAAYKAQALAPLGIQWNGEPPRLYLSEAEKSEALELLASFGLTDTPFISLDVTHRHPTRRWPAAHYAALADRLAADFPGLHFLLPYGPGEEEETRAMAALATCRERIHIPDRVLGLRQMAACIDRAAMQIGNCSAPRHMAVALDVPSVTILGATSQGWSYPGPEHIALQAKEYMPMPCQSCNANACSIGMPCLADLTPEIVYPRIKAHLEQYGQL
jgi:heptosyltransferase-2/heptosyltransferase-3